MVVVALRGSNIPVLPVPGHNSVLFSQSDAARSCRYAEKNRADVPLKRNFFPAALHDYERRCPMWFINQTE